MLTTLIKLSVATMIMFNLTSCSEDSEDYSSSTVADFTTVKYDYQWPSTSSLDGYKIRFIDTTFVREHRLFQEYLADGYSHAFVYDFTIAPGTDHYRIYGYENDNPKYSSNYYSVSGFSTDNKETITLTTYYQYKDISGLDLEGRDHCELYPTSAAGGTYMCWGQYPVPNTLYDAKTGVYEFVVDPTRP